MKRKPKPEENGELDADQPGEYTDKEVLAYRVAQLVCGEGMAFARAAKVIYGEKYAVREDQAKYIMQIKRALKYALDRKILVINPPLRVQLAERLTQRYSGCKFEVVEEDPKYLSPEMVCRHAAVTIAQQIGTLIKEKEGDVVIANAGGPTISRVVHFLQSEALLGDGWSGFSARPQFMALNSGATSNEYGSSSNFLAVRMAEIYEGKHIAVFPGMPERIEHKYQDRVEERKIDLVICGAGSHKGLFTRMLKELVQNQFEGSEAPTMSTLLPPDKVAGDVAFIPLDHLGGRYHIESSKVRELVTQQLKPRLGYNVLKDLAREGKVILVLTQRQDQEGVETALGGEAGTGEERDGTTAPPPKTKLLSKVHVTRAILRQNLASHCILGAHLARQTLNLGD